MAYIFPRWANRIPAIVVVSLGALTALIVWGGWYYLTPDFYEVGYQPEQPVDYNHQLHAGQLGIDCRYCHSQVEESPHSNVPSNTVCMSCHAGEGDVAYLSRELWNAHKINANLIRVREAYETGEPIRWRRIHKVPEYAHFNHAVHVNAGVSCYSCHGRMDQQVVARQEHSLGMGWCLDCHRNPEEFVVDVRGTVGDAVAVTDLAAVEAALTSSGYAEQVGMQLVRDKRLQPPEHCAACHY